MRRYYAAPSFLHRLFALRKNVWNEESRLVAEQERKLQATVKHAYATVPFYHELFDAHNVTPAEIKTISDLEKIPLVTRKDVQRNLDRMVSRKISAG